ncbi:MAG: hypothetical protein CMP48_20345 [Rickettsiales bacterium]|nr:hypothetical protein [Rickettsiales bacterium]
MVWLVVGLPLSIPELKWLLVGQRLGDGFTMYRDLYDYTGPVAVFFYKWLDIIFGKSRWVHVIFSTLLITIQASMLNGLLIRNKAYNENNYLPAFVYVICMSATMDFFSLSPQLISVTFIIMALNHVFRRIDNVITDELFLYSGIYLGLALMCYLPSVIFFVIFLLSLILFSSAVARRILMFVYGASVVFIIIWGYYYWFDASADLLFDFFVTPFLRDKVWYVGFLELIKISAFLILALLLGISVVFTQRVTNFQQKMQQVMLLFIVAGFGILFLSSDLMTADLVFFVPSITFFLVYYFLGLKRRFWKILLPYGLIIGLVAYPYFWMNSTVIDALIVANDNRGNEQSEETLMGIGLEINDYRNYHLGGPFLDPFVSNRKIEQLNYFDGVSGMFYGITTSEPDLIHDELGIAPTIFQRFPEFAKSYEQSGANHYQKISN